MDVFPAFWRLDGRRVLVIGGGDAAVRKLRLVARTPADITVFDPSPSDEVWEFAANGRIRLEERTITAGDIDGFVSFAIVATDDDHMAQSALDVLNAARVPANSVDRTEQCDFLIPSIVDRNPVVIGIASNGTAPVLAKNIRSWIEAILPARIGNLARFAGRFRAAVGSVITDGKARKAFWESFFDGPIADKVLAGDDLGAGDDMIAAINRGSTARRPTGAVNIVELDPTQGDLISLRAVRLLQGADLILYRGHFLAPVGELFRRDADRVEITRMDDALRRAQTAARDGLRTVIVMNPGEAPPSSLQAADIQVVRHGPVAAELRAAANA